MGRYVLSDAEVEAIQDTQASGEDTVGVGQGGYPYGLPHESYTKKGTRQQYIRDLQVAVSDMCRVDKDDTDDLSYLVTAGRFNYRGAVVTYAGAVDQAVTANNTNYIYLALTTGSAVLTVSTSSFPADAGAVPHIRLAEIVVGASSFDYDDITDRRQSAAWSVLGDYIGWEDLRVPLLEAVPGGANDPDLAKYKDNGAASTGVYAYHFDDGGEEELFFAVQLPHAWKEATDITAHVHWTPKVGGGAGDVVSWGLEYVWADIGESFGNTTIIYSNTHFPADGTLAADKHYRTNIGTIDGTGYTISSMLSCRVFRDATGAGETDDLAQDAVAFEVDFHYMRDAGGSRIKDMK